MTTHEPTVLTCDRCGGQWEYVKEWHEHCRWCDPPRSAMPDLGYPPRLASNVILGAVIHAEAVAAMDSPGRRPDDPYHPEGGRHELPVVKLKGDRRTTGVLAAFAFCGIVVALGAKQLEDRIEVLELQILDKDRRIERLRYYVHNAHETEVVFDVDRRCIQGIHHRTGKVGASPVSIRGLSLQERRDRDFNLNFEGHGTVSRMATCPDFAWTRSADNRF